MSFFKWFVIYGIVSLHGLVAFVAYEQRAKVVWLNKKINALYRTHRLGGLSNRDPKVLKCYKKSPPKKSLKPKVNL